MIHVGWDEHLFGARNCRKGEYDACRYSVLVIGMPVYFSFRGCFHVIRGWKLQPAERRERMREFARTFLGLADLARRTLLPLKPMRSLKRMWFYEYFLWLSGLTVVPGASFLLLALLADGAADPLALVGAVIVGLVLVLFVSGVVGYLSLRRPSPRQARIRGVAASRLGPFSDPADWVGELVARVAPAFGVPAPSPDELIRTAERLLKEGHYEDALLVARMALADPSHDLAIADRAESITEDCLRSLAGDY